MKLQRTADTKENGIRPRFREELVKGGGVLLVSISHTDMSY